MNIAIGADHRGFELKERLKEHLTQKGYGIIDTGTQDRESVDYPLYAQKVAFAIQDEKAQKGILVCGSGIGVCIAANKFKGIRAANVPDVKNAELASKHNNANVVCFAADFTSVKKAKKIIDKFLATSFEGGRHQRRIDLIKEFELKNEGR